MKKVILSFIILFAFTTLQAQVPQPKLSAEMKQEIEVLKKEIKELEAEIKATEKTDPEEAAQMKKELASLKTILGMMGGSVAAAPAKKPAAANPAKVNKPKNDFSPLVPLTLKQPVAVPTAAQANDKLLWYRGRKLNDSTLVTTKGMLVQYSRRRELVILQPDKKTDPFQKTIDELAKNDDRKNAMAERFVQMDNGFLYYPLIATGMEVYDDLAKSFAPQLKNTIELPKESLPPDASDPAAPETTKAEAEVAKKGVTAACVLKHLEEQAALAKKLIQALPPAESFPAPPARNLGICASCDTALLARQRHADSIWVSAYQGREDSITSILLGIERTKALSGIESTMSIADLVSPMMGRMDKKDNILLEKYGQDLRYTQLISTVVLGHERQRQLLGMADTETPSLLQPLMKQAVDAYKKYFNEQVELKNHDFVLNLPFHIGALRQQALLGGGEDSNFGEFINSFLEYNRFALTTEIDFIYEKRDDDKEIELKATGNLKTSVKKYAMLVPDSCTFRLIPYTTDITSQTLEKVTIPMTVMAGSKTMRDEDNKLVTYQYSGPESFPLQFPEFRINFCNTSKPDTAFMTGFVGDEETARQFASAMKGLDKHYKSDLLIYANYVFYADEIDGEGAMDLGNEILSSIASLQGQTPASTPLGKLKQQYDGKKQMDNHRQALMGKLSNDKTAFLFTANNKSTVLTDTYNDFKKQIEDNTELTKGQIHLRLVHEPVR